MEEDRLSRFRRRPAWWASSAVPYRWFWLLASAESGRAGLRERAWGPGLAGFHWPCCPRWGLKRGGVERHVLGLRIPTDGD